MHKESRRYERSKYPQGRPPVLENSLVKDKTDRIEAAILDLLLKFNEEYRERGGYPFVGAVLFGSWYHGNPHTESDLDLGLIIDQSCVNCDSFDDGELARLLEEKLSRIGIKLDRYIRTYFVPLDEPQFEFSPQSVLHGDFRVITPFREVCEQIKRHSHFRFYPARGVRFVEIKMPFVERPVSKVFDVVTGLRQWLEV